MLICRNVFIKNMIVSPSGLQPNAYDCIRMRIRNFFRMRMRMSSCMSTFECECLVVAFECECECFEFAFECVFESAHSNVYW